MPFKTTQPALDGGRTLDLIATTPTRTGRLERDRAEVQPRAGSRLESFLADGPGWALLAVIVYAPWAYGCTREWAIQILNVALYSTLAWWLTGSVLRRSIPRVHPVLLVAVGVLLLQGWWMTLNSGWIYDAAFHPHPRPNWFSALPGSINHLDSWPTMLTFTAMLGAACLANDLGHRAGWPERLGMTMGVAGVSVIVLGLAQKLTQAPGIFWQSEGHAPTFFATFRYHANAGAFINLVWPTVAALLYSSLRRQRPRAEQFFWGSCWMLAIAGALANTSRASGFITALLLLGGTALFAARRLRRRETVIEPAAAIGATLALALVVVGLIAMGGLDSTIRRWQQFGHELTLNNSRLMGAQTCVEMLPRSGWLGFGPGTFRTAFPFFNRDTTEATRGVWLQAHQDYLQTLVEWGWIGASFWCIAIFGAMIRLGWLLRPRGHLRSRTRRGTALGILVALAGVLIHALVDFPLQMAAIQFYFALLLGLAWSFGRENQSTRHGGPQGSEPAARAHERSTARGAFPEAHPGQVNPSLSA